MKRLSSSPAPALPLLHVQGWWQNRASHDPADWPWICNKGEGLPREAATLLSICTALLRVALILTEREKCR